MPASTSQFVTKSSKRKNAKVSERPQSPAPSTGSGTADKTADSQDETFESPYIKELNKNIRNLNKKITNASKTDSLLIQHEGKSLDELVAAKFINTDQKAQVLKKPALQTQLVQLEEQLVQYKKVHDQYCVRAAADKVDWEKSIEKIKVEVHDEAKQNFEILLHDNLLILSQFLRLAAYRREEAKDPESDESQAIEGVLLAIYAGDESAVASMRKLAQGSADQILSVPGEPLHTTYSEVKTLAREYKMPFCSNINQPAESQLTQEVTSDPTVASATAAELDAATHANGQTVEPVSNGIANASVEDYTANTVAESHWDAEHDNSPLSQGWEELKSPGQAEEPSVAINKANDTVATPHATPVASDNPRSWAEDHTDAHTEVGACLSGWHKNATAYSLPFSCTLSTDRLVQTAPMTTDANEGFRPVQRNRGRSEREGVSMRGRGRGEWRGRSRGECRAHGRVRHNGGNGGMPSRGPRHGDES